MLSEMKIIRRENSTDGVRGVVEIQGHLNIGDSLALSDGGPDNRSVLKITRLSKDELNLLVYTEAKV